MAAREGGGFAFGCLLDALTKIMFSDVVIDRACVGCSHLVEESIEFRGRVGVVVETAL